MIACLALTGWGTGVSLLKTVIPGLTPMVPITAICFILAGLCLWCQTSATLERETIALTRGLAVLIGLIALFTLTEFVLGWDSGLERWLINTSDVSSRSGLFGHMSPNSALAFLFESCALLLLNYETPRQGRPAQNLAFIAGMLAWLALLGYSYRATPLDRASFYPGMALHTAIAMIILSVGILSTHPDRGLMAVITSDSAGGFLARRLLPAALIVPSLLGWMRLMGEWAGYYTLSFGTSLLVSMNIIVFLVVVWRNANSLHQVDEERQTAEAALLLSHMNLAQLVEQRTQELQQSETLKKTVLNALPQHLAVLDRAGNIIEVNRAWQQFAADNGGDEADFHCGVGANYLAACRAVRGEEATVAQQVIAGIEAVLEGDEEMFTLEYPCDSPSEQRWFLMMVVPLPQENGGAVVAHVNITEQKLASEALKISNDMLTRLQAITDTALSQVSLNKLIEEMLARVSEALQVDAAALWLLMEDGQALVLRGAIGMEDEVAAKLQIPMGQGITGQIAATRRAIVIDDLATVDVYSPSLRTRFKSLIGAPLLTDDQITGVIHAHTKQARKFTAEDSKLLQLAADRIAVAIERTRLYESEQQARIRAEEASRLKDEFLAVVSHELRSPLNAIIGWVTLLRGGRLNSEDIRRALETIERSARSQNRLVGDLLDVSGIISGKLRLNVQAVQLAPIIEAAIAALAPAAEAKSIRLQQVLDSAAGPVSGDSDRLQQVVWNLVSNAIRFTEKGGRVQVRLERVNSQLEIIVSDTGRGIEPKFLPYVFDRFRQADSTSTRQVGGLGLGLSIVRHLVELHGGTVSVESPGVGEGATFIVKLPLLISRSTLPSAQRIHPAVEEQIHLDCPPQLEGLRVLIVDDDPDAREVIAAILSKCEAEVKTAASTREALFWFREEAVWKPELLISDIEMPEADGFTLIRQVRTQEKPGTRMPAIALTAYARAEDRMRSLAAGFQMHLPKPVEPAELLTVVASLAGRLTQHQPAAHLSVVPIDNRY